MRPTEKINLASPVCYASDDKLMASSTPDIFLAELYRKDFPIFEQKINGHPLVYLDSAASAQKPRMVMNAMQRFMENDYANIHRGVHELSVRATEKYEAVRGTLRRFINAECDNEIVFVRGATEAINLVAQSWGHKFLSAGDEIILTTLEHHSNIVPWQMLRDTLGIKLKIVPITDACDVRIEDIKPLFSSRTKLVSLAHVSNALGTILPIAEIIQLAHANGAKVLVDGCQAVSHMLVDVRELDADFYVFSGHKLYGPTGIGVLYGKREILKSMPPYQGGGDMITSVSFEETTFKDPPHRFEAGTPAMTEVIGLGAAVEYLSNIGMSRIARYERELLDYATEKLCTIDGLKIIGTTSNKAGIISFVMQGAHPHDIGTILDRQGVAIRAGHHCAQPLMECLGIPATARASLGLYNTKLDVDVLAAALNKVQEIFS